MRLPGSLGTRGLKGSVCRALAIARRHGVSPKRMLRQVSEFTRTTLAYGMRPTFPVVASRSVAHGAHLVQLQDAGAVFACHGLRHIDYTLLPRSDQAAEVREALDALAKSGINAAGFRAPYLRSNQDLVEVIAEHGLTFDSSEGVLWPLADEYRDHPATEAVLSFYGAPTVDDKPPLPTDGAVVQIPVSLPDDEICVERLGLTPRTIARQWRRNLQQAFDEGAVYVLQLHPERFALLREAAEEIMDMARGLAPRLWLATLAEVAEWWQHREGVKIDLRRQDGHWIARTGESSRAQLLLLESGEATPTESERLPQPVAELAVKSVACPAIGLSDRTAAEVADRLRQDGFYCERSAEPQQWCCYLDLPPESAPASRAGLIETVRQHASGPLLRLARWPDRCQAAFCVTGDIDALCLSDFFSRLRG